MPEQPQPQEHTPSKKPGEVCWLEIPTTNMPRSQAFYTAVFGWAFTDHVASGTPAGCYALFSKPGTPLCGGMPLVKPGELLRPAADGAAQTNCIVMVVEEVEAALARIVEAGGEVVLGKKEIGAGMGFSARFRDTEGNVNGVWSLV